MNQSLIKYATKENIGDLVFVPSHNVFGRLVGFHEKKAYFYEILPLGCNDSFFEIGSVYVATPEFLKEKKAQLLSMVSQIDTLEKMMNEYL